MIGKIIAHYKILERLGAGGMGVVYKAEDTKLNRLVALKFLPPYALDNDEDRLRFTNEAQAAAALDHPNICTIHEISGAEGHQFIAMAFVDGQSLRDRISAGPMPFGEIVDIAAQIAAGLAAAHAHGIIHRDIKPANIVIGKNGVVKIVDFGLAKSSISKKVTRTGTTIGTAAYMSPEQAKGSTVDFRTDIWSLGAILYEMIAGQPPFSGEHEAVVIYSILNESPRPITELRPQVPPDLVNVLDHALARDPDQRYSNALEMHHDLMAVLSGPSSGPTGYSGARVPVYASQRTPLPSAPAPKRSRVGMYAGIIGAVAVIAVLAGWFFSKARSDQEPAETAMERAQAPLIFLDSMAEFTAADAFETPETPELAAGGASDTALVADSLAADSTTTIPTIAVLYLENLSRDNKEDYFADGMTEDIIIDLSNISGWRVLSRYDVRPYRGQPLSIKQMGSALKADYLLEGAVRRANNMLRMTVSLHNVAEERTIWAQRFDRPDNDVFRVQSEIADSIATVLAVTITTDEFKVLAVPPTNSVEAYDYYLRGRTSLDLRTKEDNEEAEKMFKRALSKDQRYALAMVGLANTYLQRLDWYFDVDQKWLEEAKPLLDQAKSINSRSADLNLAYGMYYGLKGDYSESVAAARRAVELRPNDFETHYRYGFQLAMAGQLREAGTEFDTTLALKPNYGEVYRIKAMIASWTGNPRWCDRHMKRALELTPNAAHMLAAAGEYKYFRGEFAVADSLIHRAIRLKPKTLYYTAMLAELQLLTRDVESAISNLKSIAGNDNNSQTYADLGWAYRLHGDQSDAKRAFDDCAKTARDVLKINPNNVEESLRLLTAQCATGDIKDPEPELARIAAIKVPTTDTAIRPLGTANVYAALLNADKTIEALEQVMKTNVYAGAYIAAAPQFDFLRNDPRFLKLTGQSS